MILKKNEFLGSHKNVKVDEKANNNVKVDEKVNNLVLPIKKKREK